MPKQKFEVQLDESEVRIDIFLAKKCSKTRAWIQDLIRAGKVLLNETSQKKPGTKIRVGDRIVIDFEEKKGLELTGVPGELSVLFEDPYLLVLNKAQGVVVHPAAGHRGDTLIHHLLHYWGTLPSAAPETSMRPGIVHRLDKGTSGVLLIAKNREIQDALSAQFKNRTVTKTYECLVWGKVLREGKLTSSIGRDKKQRHKMSSQTLWGRAAETSFSPQEVFHSLTHLKVYPKTGRTHQIRVHLSEWGHPIVCDPLYSRGLTPKRKQELAPEISAFISEVEYPFLHASALSFTHPVSQKTLEFTAPRPTAFNFLLELLRRHP